MRIFILEDDIDRITLMLEVLSQSPLVQLQTCTSVKDAKLKFTPPCDLILLDHDLADHHYGRDAAIAEGTGQVFVKWLIENHTPESLDDPTIIVHSLNYDGGMRMYKDLRSAGYDAYRIPFGMNVLQLLKQLTQIAPDTLTSGDDDDKITASQNDN